MQSTELEYKYVALYGAFERDNFGDILFYRVTEKLLFPWPVVALSLFSSDMDTEGGGDIISATSWFDSCGQFLPKAVLCVGGETLTCNLISAFSMDFHTNISSLYRKLQKDEKQNIAKRISNRNKDLAYILSEEDINKKNKSIKFGINSVGGIDLCKHTEYQDEINKALLNFDWISVRDKKSLNNLNEINKFDKHLYPDIVTVVSKACQKEVSLASKKINQLIDQPYFVFQANSSFIKEYRIDKIAQALANICKSSELNITLQPAGLANGHDSIDDAMKIRGALISIGISESRIHIQTSRNVWDQVATIGNSNCFIGTSLHGRIVASSFGIPRVGLVNRKVLEYAKTWDLDIQPANVSIESLDKAFTIAYKTDRNILKQRTSELVALSEQGFAKAKSYLELSQQKINPEFTKEKIDEIIRKSLLNENNRLRESILLYAHENSALQKNLNSTEEILKSTINSTYWRITEPLRSIKKIVF